MGLYRLYVFWCWRQPITGPRGCMDQQAEHCNEEKTIHRSLFILHTYWLCSLYFSQGRPNLSWYIRVQPSTQRQQSHLAIHMHSKLSWIPQYLQVNVKQNFKKSLVISDHLSFHISHWTSLIRKWLQEAQNTPKWQIGHFSPSLNRYMKWRQSNIPDHKNIRRSSTWSDQRFPPEPLSPAEATKISSQEKVNNPVVLPSILQQTVSSGCSFTI